MKNRVRIIKKEFKVDEKNKVVVCELLFMLQLLGSEAIPNIMDVAMDIETWHLKKLLP